MKSFDKIIVAVITASVIAFVLANTLLFSASSNKNGRLHRVEANRIVHVIESGNLADVRLEDYETITAVYPLNDTEGVFGDVESDYLIRKIGNVYYCIEYTADLKENRRIVVIAVNTGLILMMIILIGTLIFVRQKILKPFHILSDVPFELSKGNLTVPVKESKNRFFGRFVWGIDLLRENLEQNRQKELELQREKKMLVLSVSHDIKTPLSVIKLYAKALAKGLYADTEKQYEIAGSINQRADEIEGFISQIIRASSEDFLNLEIKEGEFYVSDLMRSIREYYSEKLQLLKTDFFIGKYTDCILIGDVDRAVEVLENLIENAVKYGDGHWIRIEVAREEECCLIKVINSGSTLSETELPHIFDSFWRGSNTGSNKGSGLGLYISRKLLQKMGGEIFAVIENGQMCVTAVFVMA